MTSSLPPKSIITTAKSSVRFWFLILLSASSLLLGHSRQQARKRGGPNFRARISNSFSACDEGYYLTGYYEDRKKINSTCRTDRECFKGLECRNDQCKCSAGRVEVQSTSGGDSFCRPAPGYRQGCTTLCASPLVCRLDTYRPLVRLTTCQCPPEMLWSYGHCYRKCDDDQFYSEEKQRCQKRCRTDEVRIGDSCLRVQRLGDSCMDGKQCTAAFSTCSDQSSSVCECLPGFRRSRGGNACEPEGYWCPNGMAPFDPASGNNHISCQIREKQKQPPSTDSSSSSNLFSNRQSPIRFRPIPIRNNNSNRGGSGQQSTTIIVPSSIILDTEDTCPPGFYCQTHSNGRQLPGHGHCCQRSIPQCPVGVPLSGATCSHREHHVDGKDYCPSATHYCYKYSMANTGLAGAGQNRLCCPKPCGPSEIFENGKCYAEVELDDPCTLTSQCTRNSGSCISGTCQCPSNGLKRRRGPRVYCEIRCSPFEFKLKNRCVRRRALGERCSSDKYCPAGGKCSEGICKCRCGLHPLNDRFCTPNPSCQPLRMPALKFFNTPMDGRDVLSVFTATYCRRDLDPLTVTPDSSLTLSDDCARGQYCNRYIYNLGVCCPIPLPTCPGGEAPETPVRSCTPRFTGTDSGRDEGCRFDEFCYQFFISSNSGEGFVCCPADTKGKESRKMLGRNSRIENVLEGNEDDDNNDEEDPEEDWEKLYNSNEGFDDGDDQDFDNDLSHKNIDDFE